MNHHAHITSLVKKLLDDQLSPQELHELQTLFRHQEAEGDVDQWLTKLWKSSVTQDETVDSEIILHKINSKINPDNPERHQIKTVRNRFIRSFMQYAAVFTLTMTVSWWLFHEKETDKPVTAGIMGINEVSVTYGSKTRIVLPDSSVVYLNSGSKLLYPSVFDTIRQVSLEGEGYFIVKANATNPFYVNTATISIKALGTKFNVKAYPEEQNVETVLITGSVEILKDNNQGQLKPIVGLMPGEKATYILPESPTGNKESPQMMVQQDSKTDLAICWAQNQLVFDAEPLAQIAIKLERWFNVQIEIRNEKLKEVRFSGRYDMESIEQVLHSLQLTSSFHYKMAKNSIIIQ